MTNESESVSEFQFKTTAKLILAPVVSVGICLLAGGIGGFATSSSVNEWYVDLNKPSFNPPNWIFAPVWTTLYVMMGVAVWLVWKSDGNDTRNAILVFSIHLVLNVLWSVLFFGIRQPGFAFIEIILLWFSIVICIWMFKRHSALAAWLLVPYLLWVSFASLLNYSIWSLN